MKKFARLSQRSYAGSVSPDRIRYFVNFFQGQRPIFDDVVKPVQGRIKAPDVFKYNSYK
jgi:hypothetical protein